MNKHSKAIAWWLDPGLEQCVSCQVHIHWEAVTFCAACDRPMCALCLIYDLPSSEVICAECAAQLSGEIH